MKKVFLCLVVMVLVGGRSFAMWPFGDTKVSLTAQLANELSAVKDRKSTRLNSSHSGESRMPSSA